MNFRIAAAGPDDVGHVLGMIEALADYEKLRHRFSATEESLKVALFASKPAAEVILGWEGESPIAFALFFHNFSTFLGRKGLYLEDLFVVETARRLHLVGRTKSSSHYSASATLARVAQPLPARSHEVKMRATMVAIFIRR